jgi:hypothetical protein
MCPQEVYFSSMSLNFSASEVEAVFESSAVYMFQIWNFPPTYNLYYVQCVDQQLSFQHMELCHHLVLLAGILTTVIVTGRY